MKNLYLLPTDKPSIIYLIKSNNKLGITSNNPEFTENFGSGTQNQNIYITSDEEIKEGDWCLCSEELIHKVVEIKSNIGIIRFQDGVTEVLDACKKIILTTDPRLAPHVQKIEDEFLEWFVKNPSCEEVFLTNDFEQVNQDNPILRGSTNVVHKYKIIIPKEEPKKVLTEEDIFNQKDIDAVTDYINKEQQKQHLIDMMKGDEELGLYDETIDSIKLEEIFGSTHCQFSVVENKLAIIYRNQLKILQQLKC